MKKAVSIRVIRAVSFQRYDQITDAGINRDITFHCMRHTFATLQLANGTDIYTISKMLGHTKVETTQIYTKVVDQKKIQAANSINLEGLSEI